MDTSSSGVNLELIIDYLKSLESRVSRLERQLGFLSSDSESKLNIPDTLHFHSAANTDRLELQIGQFWFAKSGIVVLALGIIFLLTFPYKNLPPFIPSLIGFGLVGLLLLLSHHWRSNYKFISQYLFGGSLLLFYFTTLRLYFFSVEPVIKNISVEVTLLLLANIFNLIAAYKRKSSYLCGLGITLLMITALIGNNVYFALSLMFAASVLALFFENKFRWEGFYTFSVLLLYATFFLFFIISPVSNIKNPISSIEHQSASLPYLSVLSLLVFAMVFSAGNLLRAKSQSEDTSTVVNTLINCCGSYGLFLLLTISKFKDVLPVSHLFASIIFLLIAIVFWVKVKSKYSTFIYSLLAYFALSVAIIAEFTLPNFFIWLCWQSLLVVSTAIWFRSKFIIVANFIIYLLLFIAYLILAGRIGWVSLSFGFVALLSARILNWQKDRLELKTEIMRIAYLTTAFFMFPYALYHLMPEEYVSLSWIGVALFYYLMSKLLNNKKYRLMALFTLVITIVYVLITGITMLDPSYRIVSFMVLGIVLIVTSILYTRFKTLSDSEKQNQKDKNTAVSN